ncbi:MAG: excinuclease ABC subunit UvrA [Chlorobi bacterium]|nr:excinuclease ABC subunit UvrA [Chlorobiota bacterium]
MSEKKSREWIKIHNARIHNLKNLSLELPHEAFIVVTGVSGSGKSSLVFDTIYMEGQRRYLEAYSVYTYRLFTHLKRPEVDSIEGLSPVIAIRQDTFSYSLRSTVGTLTEIYDFLRLLFARVGKPYSKSGNPIQKYSPEHIYEEILNRYKGKKIWIRAPLIRGRTGEYKDLFFQLWKQGYPAVWVNGEHIPLDALKLPKLERYKRHDIDVVVDRITVKARNANRLRKDIEQALKMGKNSLIVYESETKEERAYSTDFYDPETGTSLPDPEPNLFSFNTKYGWCPECQGTGVRKRIAVELLASENTKLETFVERIGLRKYYSLYEKFLAKIRERKISFRTPLRDLGVKQIEEILNLEDDYGNSVRGLIELLGRNGSAKAIQWVESISVEDVCPACQGYRLRPEALAFRVAGKHIGEVSNMELSELAQWVEKIPESLSERDLTVARGIIDELRRRIKMVIDIGLGYLTLNRPVRTLSGGEAQRVRLATQLGISLAGVLYILDEPTIGMHPSDIHRLLKALRGLVERNNTVLVVEHDVDTMREADFLVELGEGGGMYGGKIVNIGWKEEFLERGTTTAKYILGKEKVPLPDNRRDVSSKDWLVLKGARGNNLKNVTIKIPLNTLVVVTGVSGSGKSSLIIDTLYKALQRVVNKAITFPLPYDELEGVEHVRSVFAVDQEPIGKTPRSVPATYIKVFDEIRKLFALTERAKMRGFTQSHFSFNTREGQCPECSGSGYLTIEMRLLPDVQVPCPVCKGKRYKEDILDVKFKGKNIAEVLDMTVSEAVEFFKDILPIAKKLKFLEDVGLGYIKLGQPSPTLSGGEAQRIKLARELGGRRSSGNVYILDEPTTGLHPEDVKSLLSVLHKLVDKGNTVIVIEHNLDVIKHADWIIDMGLGAGKEGGKVIAMGMPEDIVRSKRSITGKFLKEVLGGQKRKARRGVKIR